MKFTLLLLTTTSLLLSDFSEAKLPKAFKGKVAKSIAAKLSLSVSDSKVQSLTDKLMSDPSANRGNLNDKINSLTASAVASPSGRASGGGAAAAPAYDDNAFGESVRNHLRSLPQLKDIYRKYDALNAMIPARADGYDESTLVGFSVDEDRLISAYHALHDSLKGRKFSDVLKDADTIFPRSITSGLKAGDGSPFPFDAYTGTPGRPSEKGISNIILYNHASEIQDGLNRIVFILAKLDFWDKHREEREKFRQLTKDSSGPDYESLNFK